MNKIFLGLFYYTLTPEVYLYFVPKSKQITLSLISYLQTPLQNWHTLFDEWLILAVLIILILIYVFAQYKYLMKKISQLEKKIRERTTQLKKSRTLLISELEDRVKAEDALKKYQFQFSMIWEKSIDGMRLTDKDGIVITVNEAYCKLVDKKKEELENKTFALIYKEYDEEKSIQKYRERFETRTIEPYYEREFVLWNDQKVWFEVSSTMIEFEDKSALLLLIFRNVTERRNSQEALVQYANRLEETTRKLQLSETKLKELNANKDKFFSIISHDLRSPFNSILGISDIMISDFDSLSSEEMRSLALNIHRSTRKVYGLIDDLLQWSRLQTGHIEYSPTKLNLRHKVENSLAVLIGNALMKGITVLNNIDENINVFADEKMLSSIIQNLLSNSIKFTEKAGIIEIQACAEDQYAIIMIKDNGIGIQKNSLGSLFSTTGTSQLGTAFEKGTGLGLIICKEFVELNHGTINVESDGISGSTFTFTIPLSS